MAAALQAYPWMMTGTGNPPAAMDVKRPLDVASLKELERYGEIFVQVLLEIVFTEECSSEHGGFFTRQ
ncbi:hypothetical protein HID58_091212 [Brassica napus]|uniref:Uncharacterized protein n=1 Tax=Brassica napus TaxID=3708 RepID=A0ABQ7X3S9_BRANA|nr:hypothetical protein HID58_091212 [Brassica napus]